MAPSDPAYGLVEAERHGVVGVGDDRRVVPTERGRYPLFYRRLAAALRGEAEVPVDPRDALAALEVIEEARRTAG
jgi:scyllo-inositol 2-dehydrogenase (NADP+)